jgi:hypothetical protein
MARIHKQSSRKKSAYLTKRVLLRATGKATRSISSEAMHLKGYVVQAENGWIVKIDGAGNRENISEIGRINTNRQVALD